MFPFEMNNPYNIDRNCGDESTWRKGWYVHSRRERACFYFCFSNIISISIISFLSSAVSFVLFFWETAKVSRTVQSWQHGIDVRGRIFYGRQSSKSKSNCGLWITWKRGSFESRIPRVWKLKTRSVGPSHGRAWKLNEMSRAARSAFIRSSTNISIIASRISSLRGLNWRLHANRMTTCKQKTCLTFVPGRDRIQW